MVMSEFYEVEVELRELGYGLDHMVASGAFGTVWKAVRKWDGFAVAVKVVDAGRLNLAEQKQMQAEMDLLSGIHHPHIVKLFDVIQTSKFIVLVMEYLGGGDLFERLQHVKMAESEVVDIGLQLLSALDYLHRHGVAHRDVKLENIVFATSPWDKKPVVKLVDFGFAQPFQPNIKVDQSCGTVNYMSPQVVGKQPYDPFKVDTWSLGVVLYALITARFPFYGKPDAVLIQMILHGHPSFHEEQWLECSADLIKIIVSLLSKKEEERPTAKLAQSKLEKLRSGNQKELAAEPRELEPRRQFKASRKSVFRRLKHTLDVIHRITLPV
mmetsp:Transcript_13523/g.27644  ORF Transcript_13523/g.27644 Transcript_13523/m.27644 type:complete len:325 (-) Transcript_13523:1291-2265(-)